MLVGLNQICKTGHTAWLISTPVLVPLPVSVVVIIKITLVWTSHISEILYIKHILNIT